jgi:uncharacterized protein YihD (DUF1040 family)
MRYNPRLILLINTLWAKNPDLRLCQLLQNPFPPNDMYYTEDDVLESKLREYYEIEEKEHEEFELPDWGYCD